MKPYRSKLKMDMENLIGESDAYFDLVERIVENATEMFRVNIGEDLHSRILQSYALSFLRQAVGRDEATRIADRIEQAAAEEAAA